MKEIEKEVVKKQIVYEITKEELDKIKREERTKGRYDLIEYARFAWHNYHLKLNVGGKIEFVKELFDFIVNDECKIKNIYNLSFQDYISKYRK